jgi:RNA polymerase sigma-70 factor (ECF subfamily)
VYRYVYSLCANASVAEEITQETFFKALKSIESFRGGCKLSVWLCQIAKNTYFIYYEKEKRTVSDVEAPERAGETGPEDDLLSEESLLRVHRALHGMDEPYREVLMLKLFGELKFAQIAELFGKTESWARVTFYRGKVKLKELLQ